MWSVAPLRLEASVRRLDAEQLIPGPAVIGPAQHLCADPITNPSPRVGYAAPEGRQDAEEVATNAPELSVAARVGG